MGKLNLKLSCKLRIIDNLMQTNMINIESEKEKIQSLPGFDLKTGNFSLPTLIIRSDDYEALDEYLIKQVDKLVSLLSEMPLVLDFSEYSGDESLESLPVIIGMLRGYGLLPVGVRGVTADQQQNAKLLELAIMPRRRKSAPEDMENSLSNSSHGITENNSLIIKNPVRSGQRVYARGRDLILLSSVSSGAEVVADGNIHSYGPIKGRILAGMNGNINAQIFCQELGAELVAIAGRYRIGDKLPSEYRGRPVIVSLKNKVLHFSPF
tara:strand:+ start:4516 stop:5313 length:798 start_codon:yes stop_codon:yes gene_type:complete